jgi:phosphoglycolate phosphatase-like HAD superfamily hydrolase
MKCVLDHTRIYSMEDHDGVHYNAKDNPDFVNFFNNAKAQAVCTLLNGTISHEEAFQINNDFYYACGDGSRGFYERAIKAGHELSKFQLDLHHEFHRVAFKNATEQHPNWIRPCDQTIQTMGDLQKLGVRHSVLTQSCPIHWTNPALTRLGIAHFFETIIGHAETGFELKGLSHKPIEIGIEKAGIHPSQANFVEDSPKNLLKAKERFPDLYTVLIHHGNAMDKLPDYIDAQFPNYLEYKKALRQAHMSNV